MSLLRRILTLAIGLMLLQGNLAAAMLPCAGGHRAAGAEHASTRGGDIVADVARVHAAMGHGDATPGAPTGTERDHQCDHRDHPDTCASMVSCVAVGALADTGPSGRRRPAEVLAIVTKAESPLTRSLPPEVPPPRV